MSILYVFSVASAIAVPPVAVVLVVEYHWYESVALFVFVTLAVNVFPHVFVPVIFTLPDKPAGLIATLDVPVKSL